MTRNGTPENEEQLADLGGSGSTDPLDYQYLPQGGAAWHDQLVAPDVAGQPPAITATSNSVVITSVDPEGNLDAWIQPFGTQGWWLQVVGHAT